MKDKPTGTNVHINSMDTGTSTSYSKRTSLTSRKTCEKPTPLDFDAFVPWICRECRMPVHVVVTRINQDDYVRQDRRSSSRLRFTKNLKFKQGDESSDRKKNVSVPSNSSLWTNNFSNAQFVPINIKAYYDNRDHLVEVAIIDCLFEINRKVIQAFSISTPFHSLLTKLTIRNGGLTSALLRDISKMLPHSNLTDVCLDDCKVYLENYGVLLENTSRLKCLSLNRCNIDDAICKDLSAKIDFGSPGCSLLVLELGSNVISDIGAIALGQSLRRNRRLLHLNLLGNKISDDGASAILAHLMEFPLTWEEIYDARQRKLKYAERKMEVYASCYEEVLKQKSLAKSLKQVNEESRKKIRKNPSIFVEEKYVVDVADAMTIDIVGKFDDPYDTVVKRDDGTHSLGNMVLCSLNIAYNNLSFISIKKIYEVLQHQDKLVKTDGATGLIRVVFEGNEIPVYSLEYVRIDMLLKKVINKRAPVAPLIISQKKKTTLPPYS